MNRWKRGSGLISAVVLTLAMLLAACGSSTSSGAKGEYVENVSLGGFALSTNGQQVIAYLCDGTVAHLSVAEWFKGTVSNKKIDITNAHGSHLVATLTPQAVTGTITLKNGRSSSLAAKVIPNLSGDNGLFRTEQTINGVRYLGGWILPPAASASAVSGVEDFLAGPLVPLITCCNPEDRGGIIDEQTGALILTPAFNGNSVDIPNLGTLRITQCRLGAC